MDEQPDPLTLPLRDIHFPEPISWWPLTPAWWILIISILLIFTAITFLYLRRKRYMLSPRAQSISELNKLKLSYLTNANDHELLINISLLIRHVAIKVYPRVQVASLSGEKWLTFLDRFVPDQAFSNGSGQVLSTGPYQAQIEFDAKALLELTQTWIVNVTKAKPEKSHD